MFAQFMKKEKNICPNATITISINYREWLLLLGMEINTEFMTVDGISHRQSANLK